MRKKLFCQATILVFFILLLQTFALADSEYYYLIEISSKTFLPSTIYAGNVISLAVDIKNRGSVVPIEDLNASLDVGEQFEAIKLEDNISLINPRITRTLVFKFRAKDNILPGYYPAVLTMNYSRNGETVTEKQSIQIPISKTEKNLDITINPEVIGPGTQANLSFILKNIGGNPVSNIAFSWAEPNNLLLPLGSDNKRYISVLEAGSEKELSYNVGTDPNMATGIYLLNITVSFADINGLRTQTSQVGLIIGGITDFEVSAEKQSTGQISISIANIGSNNAASVVVKIPEQPGIIINGSSSAILGSINKGDYTLANFQVQQSAFGTDSNRSSQGFQNRVPGQMQANPDVNAGRNFRGTQAGQQSMTVQIDYTDTTGERQSVKKTIALSNVTSTSTATSLTERNQNSQQSLIYWILLAAAIIISAVFDKIKGKLSWKRMTAVWLATATAFFAISLLLNSNIIAGAAIATVSIITVVWFSARAKKRETETAKFSGERKK